MPAYRNSVNHFQLVLFNYCTVENKVEYRVGSSNANADALSRLNHSAKSLLCDTVYYNVYSNISSNISCLRIEHYKQMRILKYCQSRAVSGILANL